MESTALLERPRILHQVPPERSKLFLQSMEGRGGEGGVTAPEPDHGLVEPGQGMSHQESEPMEGVEALRGNIRNVATKITALGDSREPSPLGNPTLIVD
jgi:hypothetical protein